MKKFLASVLAFTMILSLSIPSASAPQKNNGYTEAEDTYGAVANAVVDKIGGNKNGLAITVSIDGDIAAETYVLINNNSAGEFEVGDYRVYVSTYGNTKIDFCFITYAPEPEIEEPPFATVDTVRVYKPVNSLASLTLPDPTNDNLPKWRGFNKLNLYSLGEGSGYDDNGLDMREADFILMRDLGFNFIRFPMDYRFFYNKTDKTFDMEKIKWIDHAIEYGIKYNIHIELNLHYAPGYRVANGQNLDTLLAEKDHFIEIWKFFAKRYKNIPNTVLDFNLINEPSADDFIDWTGYNLQPAYAELLKNTIGAIRAERPDRLIVLDADHRNPYDLSVLGISLDNIYQSQHGYGPFSLTHRTLGASLPPDFTNGQLTWPINNYFNGFLYASWKSTRYFGEDNVRAVFNHPTGFGAGAVKVEIAQQSGVNSLTLAADGVVKETVPVQRGSGIQVSFADDIIAGAKKVEIYLGGGDWVIADSYTLGGVFVDCTNADWGYPPSEMTVGIDKMSGPDTIKSWYLNSKQDGIPKMFGEMGCIINHSDWEQLSYRAALMKDYADAFEDYPWAYWEFKGGNMSMFRLNRSGAHTAPYTVTDSSGNELTYYIDALWYNSIKHVLDNPYDGLQSPEPPAPPPPPPAGETAVLFDDFEGYADDAGMKTVWSTPDGFPGEVTLSLESNPANVNSGSNSIAMSLDGSTQGFDWWIAEARVNLPASFDWTDRTAISLWAKASASNIRLVAMINDSDGNTFRIEDNVIPIPTAGGVVHIKFDNLILESGTAEKPDPSKFTALILRVALPSTNFVGTVYFDDIYLGYTETLMPPKPKPSAVLIDDFEGYADDAALTAVWFSNDTEGATTYEISLETAPANVGGGNKAMSYKFNTVENPWWTMLVGKSLPASIDWENHDNISFWLKKSSNFALNYLVTLFYADGTEFYSQPIPIPASAGIVSVPLNALAGVDGEKPDFGKIAEIQIRFNLNWPPTLAGTLYIDDIYID